MSYPAGVIPWKIKAFKNAHDNFTQPLAENQSFDLLLSDPSFRKFDALTQYRKCTENFQWIIKKSLEKKMKIRAMGSGWSFTKVAVNDEAIINTKRLRHKFSLSKENFSSEFLEKGANTDNYRFLQCGNSVIGINEYLEQQSIPAKSLRASGGSNGQTIVGAFSTGTHGAALFYGALSEMVHGIHLITGPEEHFYIERASNKITSEKFHEKIGATVILDDALFNAVLVSFGSFGIIHGVLIEIEDIFLLEQKRKRIVFDESLEKAICFGDFSAIEHHLKYPLSDKDHAFYHFELALNPHDFKYNDSKKGIYMRAMYKTAFRPDYIKIDPSSEGYTYGDDTLGLMQKVLDKIQSRFGKLNKVLIPKMVNSLFDMAYDRPEEATGTIGETFRNTVFRGQLYSAAFGLNIKDVKRVVDHCLKVNKIHKLAGIMAFRFVKGTQATLGFTHWENTCVLELDGVDAKINYLFAEALAECLEKEDIPYTLHWGKMNGILNPERLKRMYGEENINNWKQQRSKVMSKEIQQLFNNAFMDQCGLSEYQPHQPDQTPANPHKEIPGNPSTAISSKIKLNDRSNGFPLKVLTEEDWKFWVHEGYVVIKNAVSKEQVKKTADFLWEFEEKDPNDPETWYTPPRAEMQMKELTNTGMVEVYNHQTLWDNRQVPKVHAAFADIWGTEKLWCTIDRANLNFPLRAGFDYKAFIHWDYDPETKPQNVQGVLALADQMDEEMGGFQCIPELYRTYDTWKLTQPENRNRFQPDTTGFDIKKVLLEAGDLLIFNSTLPHGIRANRSKDKVRMAQYISMMPAEEENEQLLSWRISSWRDRKAPEGYAFPGDPRELEKKKYKTADLSPLGRKLLGLDKW